MKYPLLILSGFFFLSMNIQAQSGSYNQHASYTKLSELGLYERELPAGFLFLVEDDFQKVLANPAKAYLYNRPFAASTIWNAGNTPISFGLILPDKWVMTAAFQPDQVKVTRWNRSGIMRKQIIPRLETW